MGKGANKALLANSGTAQGRSGQTYGESQGDYNFLDPTLKAEATNPQGYTPQQMAYMNTASQQSAGGGAAATTGQANLEAARSKNAGGFQGAIGTANRGTQRQASQNALQVQENQANLQQAQKQQALQSLQSLYGTNSGAGLNYLNSSNTALNAENQGSALANQDFWRSFNNIADTASSAAGAAGGGG